MIPLDDVIVNHYKEIKLRVSSKETAYVGGGIMGFTGWYCGLYIKHARRRPCLVQINLRLQISYLANLKENGYNLIV